MNTEDNEDVQSVEEQPREEEVKIDNIETAIKSVIKKS